MESLGFNKNIKKSGKPKELSGFDYKNVPHNEETLEEKERLNKNDPGISIKTGGAFKYIPKEEIPEYNGDVEELLAEKIDNSSDKKEEFLELDDSKEEEIERGKRELEEKPINFFQDNTHVAHVGPMFENQELDDERFENEINLLKKEAYLGRNGLKEDFLPSFLSKSKFLRKLTSYKTHDTDYRKDKKRHNTGAEKDNLKTMSDDKKERMNRGNLREIKRDNKNYEDPFEREEDEVLDQIFGGVDIEEDRFKGDPEIEKLQEEEDMKMSKSIDESYRIGELEKDENK